MQHLKKNNELLFSFSRNEKTISHIENQNFVRKPNGSKIGWFVNRGSIVSCLTG